MSIQNSELKIYRATTNDDTASNGGRMSMALEADNLSNSVWKHITSAQRTGGATQYRKFALKADNADNIGMTNVRVGLGFPTSGGDRVYCFPGTQTDIQSDISSPDRYGAGKLDANVSAGATTITVLVENPATIIFRDDGLIRLSDMASVFDVGNEEEVRISGTPTIAGSIVTIALATPLANAYSASDTYVAALMEFGDAAAGVVGTPVVTSTAGTFDKAHVSGNNIGGIRHTVTLTFYSATQFGGTSDVLGSLGFDSNTSSIYAPTNETMGAPLFSIDPAAWGGTFEAGDTVVIVFDPCAVLWWEERIVPVGMATLPPQTLTRIFFAESAG